MVLIIFLLPGLVNFTPDLVNMSVLPYPGVKDDTDTL